MGLSRLSAKRPGVGHRVAATEQPREAVPIAGVSAQGRKLLTGYNLTTLLMASRPQPSPRQHLKCGYLRQLRRVQSLALFWARVTPRPRRPAFSNETEPRPSLPSATPPTRAALRPGPRPRSPAPSSAKPGSTPPDHQAYSRDPIVEVEQYSVQRVFMQRSISGSPRTRCRRGS